MRMKKLSAMFLVAIVAGCGQSPRRETLVGRWESGDKQHTLDLRADGTFSHETGASPAIAADKGTGVIYIAPTGKWSLQGRELTISMSLDGTYDPNSDMILDILHLTGQEVKMRFAKNPPFTFTRGK